MNDLSRKTRWLVQTLILSAALNIAFTAIFFYFIFRANTYRLPLLFSPSKEIVENNPFHHELLVQLKSLSFEKLLGCLEDHRIVVEPYQVRDLALGMLVKQHNFDLNRALGQRQTERKTFLFQSDSLTLYPNLKDCDFVTVLEFAKTEKWPLTCRGLFERIKKEGISHCDPELLQTFCQTFEFTSLEMLFHRAEIPVRKGNLLSLIMEGNWEQFKDYFQKQQECCDLSSERRREFLLSYLSKDSTTAAYFLLLKDISFVLETFNEEQLLHMLSLLSKKTSESVKFMNRLLSSSHSEVVKQKAALKLVEYSGRTPEEEVAGHLIPRPGIGNLRPEFREPTPKAPSPQTHVIQQGESLWIISKRYGVSIDELVRLNRLQSTVIRPGRTLSIPLRK